MSVAVEKKKASLRYPPFYDNFGKLWREYHRWQLLNDAQREFVLFKTKNKVLTEVDPERVKRARQNRRVLMKSLNPQAYYKYLA